MKEASWRTDHSRFSVRAARQHSSEPHPEDAGEEAAPLYVVTGDVQLQDLSGDGRRDTEGSGQQETSPHLCASSVLSVSLW